MIEALNDRVRALMATQELNQKQLAKVTGIDPSTISRVLRGDQRRRWTDDQLGYLAGALQMPLPELVAGTDYALPAAATAAHIEELTAQLQSEKKAKQEAQYLAAQAGVRAKMLEKVMTERDAFQREVEDLRRQLEEERAKFEQAEHAREEAVALSHRNFQAWYELSEAVAEHNDHVAEMRRKARVAGVVAVGAVGVIAVGTLVAAALRSDEDD